MSYQFFHIEAYGRTGAHKKNSTARKSSMAGIQDEMIRVPHACTHVAEPLPPLVLFGMQPKDAFTLATKRADHAVDKIDRKLRRDAPIVVVGVASWPEPVLDLNSDQQKMKRYHQWRDETVAWLTSLWSEDLKTVVQHFDEAYPHIHFIIVPRLLPDRRLRLASIHPGHRAAEKVAKLGGTGRDQKKAYKDAMVDLQDDYYERVSVKFALVRVGPRRQRLTRAEWIEQKRQAKALAQALVDVQTRASNLKAIARNRITAREAEVDQAAQAKIDAITTQSYEHITILKHKAIERISDLKGRVNKLEGALWKKDAILAAQAAELEVAMGLLRENGLAPNFQI